MVLPEFPELPDVVGYDHVQLFRLAELVAQVAAALTVGPGVGSLLLAVDDVQVDVVVVGHTVVDPDVLLLPPLVPCLRPGT